MTTKEIAKKYFEFFNNADIKGLNEIYDDKIELIDWNGRWKGKSDVLKMNQSLFDNSILIKLIEVSEIGNRVYCKIDIEIGDEKLKVMDVIDTNDEKIIKIEAYNG
tara:strand:+ start:189 stop:506 length:318 start_codon:yes stop_codon:yes gene_type:complete